MANTVVSMQLQLHFAQGMVFQEVVDVADNCIGPLPCVHCLICQVVNLPWYPLTADPKYPALPRGFEIHGTWLEGIMGIVHLLCIIERVVEAERPLPR